MTLAPLSFNQLSARMMQQLVSQLLALDAESKGKLAEFQSSRFLISITDLNLDYLVTIEQAAIKVTQAPPINPTNNASASDTRQHDAAITASISGTSSDFLAAMQDEHQGDSLFKGQLSFSGKINSAKALQAFAQNLAIDWQEPLAKIFGDPMGHSLAQGVKGFAGWLKNSLAQAPINLSEYLQEEIKLTPSHFELTYFSQGVDQVRSQLDRLNARVQRLKTCSNQSRQSSQGKSN